MRTPIKTLVTVAAVGLASSGAQAAIYTINATAVGWYNNAGYSLPGNTNYLAGFDGDSSGVGTNLFRDWFVFDLQSLPSGTIASATLTLYNPAANDAYGTFGNGFSSVNSSETFQICSVATPVDSLAGGTGGIAAFNSLGTGTLWGGSTVDSAANGSFVTIALNPSFESTAATFLANGSLALGGSLAGDSTFTTPRYVFAWTGEEVAQPTPSLTLDIQSAPEPSSLGFLSGCVAVSFFLRYRPIANPLRNANRR
jgi:hypothetical protein